MIKKGKKDGNQAIFFNGLLKVEKFMETSKLKHLNKLFLIENISPVSKLFFYFGLIGVILIIISLFFPILWVLCWVYVLIFVVLLGFIFAKPGTKYNPILVLSVFIFLMFIPSIYRETMVSATLDVNNPRTYKMLEMLDASTYSRFDIEILQIEAQLEPKIKYPEFTLHDLRANMIISRASYDDCHKYFIGYIDHPFDVEYDTRAKLARLYNLIFQSVKYEHEVAQDWVLDWETILSLHLKTSSDKARVRNMIIDGGSYEDVEKYYDNLDEKHERVLGYYCNLLYQYRVEIGGLTEPEIKDNQNNRNNASNDATEYETFDISGFMDSVNKLTENPLEDLTGYVSNFIDVLNWIVFLAIIAYGGSAVVDGIKLDLGKIAKKLAQIGLAIAIMTFIYSIFQAIDIEVKTVWDTVGSAWENLMGNIGFSMMDASGNTIVTANSTIDGIYKIIPIVLSFACFGMAYGFRKTDLKSVLFSKDILKENTITIERSKISIPIVIIMVAMIVYVVGYFLVTADPQLIVDPIITAIFYVSALMVLMLIGSKVLILNTDKDVKSFISNTIKWTVFGLAGLFFWFQVFQPFMFELNLIDTESGILTLSQDTSILESDVLEQLFLIATPETLIFQILFVGVGNRVYFYFKKTRILKAEEKALRQKRWNLAVKYKDIKITKSVSKDNLRKIAKAVVLKQKIDELGETIETKKISKIPYRYFILPTILSGLIGSFFFSWYHSFRRGIGFALWWYNPMLGLVYFGAGFFLCLVAYFSFPAAILVHFFNNILAIALAGG